MNTKDLLALLAIGAPAPKVDLYPKAHPKNIVYNQIKNKKRRLEKKRLSMEKKSRRRNRK